MVITKINCEETSEEINNFKATLNSICSSNVTLAESRVSDCTHRVHWAGKLLRRLSAPRAATNNKIKVKINNK